MRLAIAAPGRPTHPGAVAWTSDLYGRVGRILPIRRLVAREARRTRGGVDPLARSRESAALAALVPAGAVAVGLDVGGRRHDSDAFHQWMIGLAETGTRELCFLIGGPDGLGDEARAVCRETLSLSPMVLPHELAEVVLLEQIYRALTRWRNLPYHR